MPPPYRPLDSKAILPRFRTVVHSDGQSLPNSHAIVLNMSKSLAIPIGYRDSSGHGVPHATPPLESARRVRNTFNQGRPPFGSHAQSYYMTVACRSIFENVLPMLSIASSILSAGPKSIRRT